MTLAEQFEREYLQKIFYFSLKKTGDEVLAEELASDISLAVLLSLHRGNVPQSMDAWVWRIALNTWRRFAKARWLSPEAETESLSEDTEPADAVDVEADAIRAEEISAMRRELAHVRGEYRTILVRHYIDNESVSTIASALCLPVGTVKTRLQNGRKALKEGMDMARTYGRRSYNPEDVTFCTNTDMCGRNGQPWSILTHKLYKNIFLEAYGSPKTAEELSMELGVAMPYMEDELEFLVRETFLEKEGKGYRTAFAIISAEAQRKISGRQEEMKAEIAAMIAHIADRWLDACAAHGITLSGHQTREELKWTTAIQIYDRFYWKTVHANPKRNTDRPDGGSWDIVGWQTADVPGYPFVGQHGGSYGPMNPELPATDFSQYKFQYCDNRYRTPEHLTHEESWALTRLARGEAVSEREAAKLNEYGYASGNEPTVIVYTDAIKQAGFLTAVERAAMAQTAEKLKAAFRQISDFTYDVTREDVVSAGIRGHQLDVAVGMNSLERGVICQTLLDSGWLQYNESMSRALGAYLYI